MNISFRGYKNPIVEKFSYGDGTGIAYVAVQLTDEGSPDLTKWKQLQKEMGIDDVQDTIMLMHNRTHRADYLYLDDKSMFFGDELRNLNSPKEEKLAVKAYTLLASITRQMANSDTFIKDTDYVKVFQKIVKTLAEVSNQMVATKIAPHAVLNRNFKEVGAFFNRGIAAIMRQYLK